eukprot:9189366-Pyramimonas_sp.AAC.1
MSRLNGSPPPSSRRLDEALLDSILDGETSNPGTPGASPGVESRFEPGRVRFDPQATQVSGGVAELEG